MVFSSAAPTCGKPTGRGRALEAQQACAGRPADTPRLGLPRDSRRGGRIRTLFFLSLGEENGKNRGQGVAVLGGSARAPGWPARSHAALAPLRASAGAAACHEHRSLARGCHACPASPGRQIGRWSMVDWRMARARLCRLAGAGGRQMYGVPDGGRTARVASRRGVQARAGEARVWVCAAACAARRGCRRGASPPCKRCHPTCRHAWDYGSTCERV